MARRLILGFWIVLFASFQAADGRDGESVGAFGDLNKLMIRGASTFASEQIKDRLWQSLDVQTAAHAKSSLRDFVAMLQDKVAEGYRYAGFPEVKVAVEADRKAGKIVVRVTEGRRLTAAEIRVEGGKTLHVADLVRHLTTPQPKKKTDEQQSADTSASSATGPDGSATASCQPGQSDDDSPVWEKGKPAHFDRQTAESLPEDIKAALADLGYVSARFANEIVRNADGTTASLRIRIFDEGVKAVLDPIEIVGNQKNCREEILGYLGLEDGKPVERSRCRELRQRLWRSGRFIKCEVEPAPRADQSFNLGVGWDKQSAVLPHVCAGIRVGLRSACPTLCRTRIGPEPMPVLWRETEEQLRISLMEYDKAPRLSEPLSPADRAMLQCQRYLLDSAHWGGDLIATANSPKSTIVISPSRGALFLQYADKPSDKRSKWQQAIAATIGEVGIYDAATGTKYAFPVTNGSLVMNLGVILSENRKDWDDGQPLLFRWGVGVKDGGDTRVPFQLGLTMAPAAFLALAHEHKAKCSIANGVLTVKTSVEIWRVKTDSGRPIDVGWYADGEKKGQLAFRVTFENGAFNRFHQELHASTARYANVFQPKRPLTSLGQFLAKDETFWKYIAAWKSATPEGVDPRVARVLCKLLAAGILAPLDDLCSKYDWSSDDSEFQLRNDHSFAQNGIVGTAAQWVFWAADGVFPRGSWPWTLSRESALSAVGKGAHLPSEIFDLYTSEESGPLCCLAGGIFALWNDPEAVREFADKGLKKLRIQDFRKDYRFLFQPDHPISTYVKDVADAVCTLNDDDVAILLKDAPPEQVRMVAAGLRALRRHRDRPTAEMLPQVLDALWQNGLHDRVEAVLKRMAKGLAPWQADPEFSL